MEKALKDRMIALFPVCIGAIAIGQGSTSGIILGVIAVAVGVAVYTSLSVKEHLQKMLSPQQNNKNSSEEKNHQTEV